jgi:uncharacterized protein (TIGR00369 family)
VSWLPSNPNYASTCRSRRTSRNKKGYVHAGVITSLADNACGYAVLSLAPADCDVLAVEFKINFLAPARAPSFSAHARVIRRGRTLTVAHADVFGVGTSGQELIATMIETVFVKCAEAPDVHQGARR